MTHCSCPLTRIVGLFVGCWYSTCVFPATVSAQTFTFENPPIQYSETEPNDPVARLIKKIERDELTLSYDEEYGYLKSILAALDVPVSSQTLVFSRTSLQLQRISPRRPRALYFNDDIYVGYCQNGDVIELAATDPKQGAMFYTLAQRADEGSDTEPHRRPTFKRDDGGCLTCHASSRTQRVPGYLMRSVFPDAQGNPKLGDGTYTTDVSSSFEDRWGGWYVSGKHGAMRHMGNTICRGDHTTFDRDLGANDSDLSDNFPTKPYLTPHSDIVALMVLGHQSQMHNAIAAANYETRQALHQSYMMNELLERPKDFVSESAQRRIKSAAQRVLKHLLFCDEFRLSDRVEGTTEFAKVFQSQGKQDTRGRSLREFDLQSRLFKYPCSYLIYSEAFAGLPEIVREQVLSGLADVLQGRDTSAEFEHLDAQTRGAIREILADTLPEAKASFAGRFPSN